MIPMTCPKCGNRWDVKSSLAGGKVLCPECEGAVFVMEDKSARGSTAKLACDFGWLICVILAIGNLVALWMGWSEQQGALQQIAFAGMKIANILVIFIVAFAWDRFLTRPR